MMGFYIVLKPFLLHNTTGRSVMVDRAETVLFGDKWYWECRRSMRFSKALRDLGDEFRRKFLNSTDKKDKTILEDDWTKMKRQHGDAKGGPYVAAHMRRTDFLNLRSKYLPSIENTAKQLKAVMNKQNLKTLFIASDGSDKEITELKEHLKDYTVYRYKPGKEILETYTDGGIAVVDQWICAHARFLSVNWSYEVPKFEMIGKF